MKFTSATFGALVRPRVLLKVIASQNGAAYFTRNQQAQALEQLTHKPIQELFQDLHLGDTSIDLSDCYVGKIKSYILCFDRSADDFQRVDKAQMKALEAKRKRNWEVRAVGLEFYTGLTLNSNNKLEPQSLWPETKEWFYYPEDLVPMEDIVVFESCRECDLVTTKRATGLVLDVKVMNKPQFYRTNSWTCKNVLILSGQHARRVKLLPFRKFKLSRVNSKIDPTEGGSESCQTGFPLVDEQTVVNPAHCMTDTAS